MTLSDRHFIGPTETQEERDLTDDELVDVLASSFGVQTAPRRRPLGPGGLRPRAACTGNVNDGSNSRS